MADLQLQDPARIKGYHAHIYYDPETTKENAALLRERVAEAFPKAVIGRWHDELVGPHSQAMYQIVIKADMLQEFLPWLMLNRLGLPVLLHPESGNGYADHTRNAAWLGNVVPIRVERFRHHD
jgi:aromatic ring-cleaving dioxygenase